VTEIVLIADPEVAAIPVHDCAEPLRDVNTHPTIRVDQRKAHPAGYWRQLRAGVLDRLTVAASRLPAGMRLLHIEGYRPPQRQAEIFTAHRDELAASRPDLDLDALNRLASRHVSPPELAPHSAGAAVDLTLCDGDGVELDLGTPINATPEQSDNACYTAADNIGPIAQYHRSILNTALTEAGLINYPTEWWHWSYGDRYWALLTGETTAIYGTVDHRLAAAK
jgi:D-alanyl-D-alanine dipeptidase